MELDTKEQVEQAIRTLAKTAAVSVVTLEERSISDQFAYTAEALQRAYGLDDSIMEEFRAEVDEAEKAEAADNIDYQKAEDARDVIFAMCRKMTAPKEIMQHVQNATEMLYVWVSFPENAR